MCRGSLSLSDVLTHCLTKYAALEVEYLIESSLPPALCLNWLKRVSTALPAILSGDTIIM